MTHTFFFSALAITSTLAGTTGDFLAPIDQSHSHPSRPDSHAPIGVMGEHTHKAGEWMASYRYMFMRMEQNYDGSSTVSDSSIVSPREGNYLVTPTDMDMQMHMLGIMYAPTDRLTLMGMLNLVDVSMNHRIGPRTPLAGQTFKTEASGIGDSSLGGLYKFFQGETHQAHFGFMALLPTADIDNEDFLPLPPPGSEGRLPYPMQLGSGSWGISPSITWFGYSGDWSYGSQASVKFYLNDNDNDYRLGNRYEATIWGARKMSDWLSLSVRANLSHWEDIHGSDPELATYNNMMMANTVPTADPDLRAGTRIDLAVGANILIPNTGARLALEFGAPVYQDLDGPQLGMDWFATAGIQFAF